MEIPIWGVRAGLAFTLFSVACSPDIRHPDNRTPAVAAGPTANVMNEAQRLGLLLETFDPNRLKGFNLEAGSNTTVGNALVSNSSTLNDVTLNLNELADWLNRCNITRLPNYQMGIEFTDILQDGSSKSGMERNFDTAGDISIIRILPSSFLRDGHTLLQDQITSAESQENATKRALLRANVALVETICSLGSMAEKFKQRITYPNIMQEEDLKAAQLAKPYLKALLEGKRQLIFTIKPSGKIS